MVGCLPKIWQHTKWVSASHWVGLTLPDDSRAVGSFSAALSSPRPGARRASRRISSGDLEQARSRSTPYGAVGEQVRSCEPGASNLLGRRHETRPVSSAPAGEDGRAKAAWR